MKTGLDAIPATRFTLTAGLLLVLTALWGGGSAIWEGRAQPASQNRLFRKFSQADDTISKRFGGSGLGLAIAGELVARMGGEIGMWSRVSGGSVFWFTLPLPVSVEAGESDVPGPGTADAVGLLALGAGGSILVVDDNPVNQRIAVRMVEKGAIA